MELKKLVDYLNSYLQISRYHDKAINGLQVENSQVVEKIGLAVDASHESILKAAEEKCNVLIVHHGLFWGKRELIIDCHFQRVRSLIMADMALYAAHLPLDAHPEVGHNVQLANNIGIVDQEPFASHDGTMIGIKGRLPQVLHISKVAELVTNAVGSCQHLIAFGTEIIRTIGIVAGSATDSALFKELKVLGIDLFVTGEPRYSAYHMAKEFGLNVFYGGHYQTETVGMKALAKHLQETFHIPAVFIDIPSVF